MTVRDSKTGGITPIAVVGMSFRGPGDATNVEKLLNMISEGRESRAEVQAKKWDPEGFYHPDSSRHGTHNVEYGHWFQQDVYNFDAPFFNVSPAEAAALDPQQRMLLECSYEAFENSGTPMSKIVGTDTSVFVSSFATDYTDMLWRDPESVPMYQCTNSGFSRSNLANRISYSFDLKGPSVLVDTACSGGLTALHLACQSLLVGDVRQALAAGSSLILGPEMMVTMSMMKFLSPDGRCYAFDERANGYARGEGVAVLLLKRLEDALADNDTIRAVIRGTGCNQDGKTPGITMPNSVSQEALIRSVYKKAALDPLDTTYVECHGTGTQAGDTTEASALSKVFSPGRRLPLLIGSVKTNIGHLEGASGLAGVVKSILMLEQGVILPNRNFERPNTKIPLEKWNLRVPTTLECWNNVKTRRVSINSFGYGGANVHAILESATDFLRDNSMGTDSTRFASRRSVVVGNVGQTKPAVSLVQDMSSNDRSHEDPTPLLFALSAFDSSAGDAWARSLSIYLSQRQGSDEKTILSSLAYTLSDRRTWHPWKAALSATTIQELITKLEKVRFVNMAPRHNIGFVFTGQGAQWCGMGRELISIFPRFRQSLIACDIALQSFGADFHVIDELEADVESSRINKALYSQPLCTALQIALVDLLVSWGIYAQSVTGHSSGEIAAAYAAGALSLSDAMLVAYARGCATANLAKKGAKGAMAAVSMETQELSHILSALENGKVGIACFNSPTSCTVSGDKSALDELQDVLRQKGVYNRRLIVDVAYHSHHMELIADSYRSAISSIQPLPGSDVKFFSSVTGELLDKNKLGVDYWVSNLVGQVKFAQSLSSLVSSHHGTGTPQIQALIEIGPHAALGGPISQVIDSEPLANPTGYFSALVRKKNAVTTILSLAADLFLSGYPIQLSAVNQNCNSRHTPLVDLPSYSWNHSKAYTAESRISKTYRQRRYPRLDLIGVFDVHSSVLEPRWRQVIRLSELPWLQDHKIQSSILYPVAGYIAMAIEAATQRNQMREMGNDILGYQFRDVAISSALTIPDMPGQVEVFITLRSFSESVRSPSNLWDEFSISSVNDENRWTEHCRGLISVLKSSKLSNLVNGKMQDASTIACQHDLREVFATCCKTEWDVKDMYEHFWETGMQYGPTFANLCDVRCTSNKCIGKVKVPDTAAVMPMKHEAPFIIHPGTLDSIIQTYLPALVQAGHLKSATIPVAIESMFISRNVTRQAGDLLTSYASSTRKDYRYFSTSMSVFADGPSSENQLVITIDDMTLVALDRPNSSEESGEALPLAFNLHWKPDVDMLTEEQLVEMINASTKVKDHIAAKKMKQTAAQLGKEILARVPFEQAQVVGESSRHLWKLLHASLESLSTPDHRGALDEISSLKNVDSTLAQAADRLSNVLTGRVAPSDVASMYDLMEAVRIPELYDNNLPTATYLHLLGHKKPSLRVLTVGPQSGPTSLNLLMLLAELGGGEIPFAVLHHSDAELNIDQTVRSRFPSWADSVGFRDVFNESGASQQNPPIVNETYDIVVAFNVLGSSPGFSKTLSAAAPLLNARGKILLVDNSHKSPMAALVWGPLPSFLSTWVDEKSADSPDVDCAVQSMGYDIYARLCPNVTVIQRAAQVQKAEKTIGLDVLVVTDGEPAGVDLQQLQTLCEDQYAEVHVASLEHARPRPGQACIVLSELSRPVLAAPTAAEWEAVKRITDTCSGIVWVTRGAADNVCSNPQVSLIQGFARTVRAEAGDKPITTLDLDNDKVLSAQAAAAYIAAVFQRMMQGGEDIDVELQERRGILHVARLIEDGDAAKQLQGEATAMELRLDQAGPCRLFAGTPGLLDSLHFTVDDRVQESLETGQIEVQVHATGINFKDVMMAMGQIAVEDLGCECSGVVSAVGDGVVGLRVGDRVACMGPGSFCTQLRVDARLAHRIPHHMELETAAALPITYVTAYHSIHNIAHLRHGETILIHAAAGGLGQALVELSQLVGARVLVTVGSTEKKRLIMQRFRLSEEDILFSRDTSFVHDVMRLTNGRGVDVIMNSLAGESLRQSWTCIAPNGRFVELGQRDITVNSRLDMAPFARNVSFTAYNLAYMLRHDPQAAHEVLAEVLALYDQGKLRGPEPLEKCTFSQLGNAFRKIQTGRHMGKMVAVANPDDMVWYKPPPASRRTLFRPDASYLLVGGVGGLGSATALWMSTRGARHLLLLNRSGADTEAARTTLATLRANGCTATVLACDVADKAQLSSVLAEARSNWPPIRGVIQGAMVLRDSMLANMTLEDYMAVVRPKVQGTWNLQTHLPADLDFFILESSISGIIGNPGQAAYAAANTFLDAFARWRRARCQPATVIDIGAVHGIGYLERNVDVKLSMERQGFAFTDEQLLMRLLEFAISHSSREPHRAQIVTGLGPWHPDTSLPGLNAPLFSRYRMLSCQNSTGSTDVDTLRGILAQSSSFDSAVTIVLSALVDQVVSRTEIPIENVHTTKSLQDYGIDSLVAVELRNWLIKDMDSVVPMLELLGAESLSALAVKIAARSQLISTNNRG
ncbi:hypothetical protein COCC4DRAFT_45906 [Bipolaris maydis ATCC 48331]|uniref:Reducing polyketide synthase PKS1 n=1 Tax=Cochliobolus heterostrophus (strain C4 / ATCC 48331 / race T) TaxID=665024 RepID=PKS1_COCH4|nr:uncharacterized protein COCC4DRAFT_45906 [Bipolaris maydis ATCC 48331]N4WHE3.1 RecName: Full=Reducing polyketide synthase PKS1; AltName: Full=T-toxin biosynthesis protein PKS1 [Bipolaris maydis ATCC 48331]AAB08104.3 polyketide synthase [Bipolaris maydis]ENH98624.1 hypothetical protein COCC4DRAFT_45906 [Bipolaris maydis ATCC 48331]KAJ5028836.1 hypothetical protein J3E73DRAFT_407898 [Bipolaris maydis]KAJ5047758.1 polyketide synthase [Bipolaris maydis]KAJ5063627.1 polyketide synthase [Bipolar